MRKYLFGIFVVIATIFTSCSKDENYLNGENKIETETTARMSRDDDRVENAIREMGEDIQTTVLAEIQDIDGNPLRGATVKMGDREIRTDERGVVVFSNVRVKSNFAYLTVKMNGYFDGSRAFVPKEIRKNKDEDRITTFGDRVQIKLFRMEERTIIDSNGGVVNVRTPYGDGSITFGSGFIDEIGKPYNGSVTVYTQYIDPMSPLTGDTMPGDLLGLTLNNQINVLATFGMVNVELRGDAGQELQIENPAEIRLPIAPDQLADAPDQIQTWYFSDSQGLWVEEDANGHKEGNEYVMTVNHFTFWNFDIGLPNCRADIYIVDQFGNPLSVSYVANYAGSTRSGTTFTGYSSGFMPSTGTVTFTATYSGTCGTYSNSMTLACGTNTLIINITSLQQYFIEGILKDCSGNPIASPTGWIEIQTPGAGWIMVPTLFNGYYRYSFITCTTPTIQILGATGTGATAIMTTTLNPAPARNIRNISFPSCLRTSFIKYSIDGAPIHTDNVSPGGSFTGLSWGGTFTGSFSVNASDALPPFGLTTLDSTTATLGFGYTYGTGANQMEFSTFSDPIWIGSSGHNITFDIISFSSPGLVEVEFNGTFLDSSFARHTITGKAHIFI